MEVGLTPTQMASYGITSPEQVVELASQVQKYVRTQELTSKIQGREFVQVEGWQFAGALLGLTGKVISYDNQSRYEPVTFKWKAKKFVQNQFKGWEDKQHTAKGVYKYFADAVMVNPEGKIISQGFAMCSNEELTKHTFDEYAILSMAQTRAIGKAARNTLAFLMKAAGYEVTPAEEMTDLEAQEEAKTEVKEVKIPEDIENQIYVFTDAKSLSDWANEQKDYHKNLTFVKKVQDQIKALNS